MRFGRVQIAAGLLGDNPSVNEEPKVVEEKPAEPVEEQPKTRGRRKKEEVVSEENVGDE